MKVLMPEPMNCTPIQMSRNPINLVSTAVPEGPKRPEMKSAERRTI